VLFDGATFADLNRGSEPFISVSATDVANGSRVSFRAYSMICARIAAEKLGQRLQKDIGVTNMVPAQ
jgi:NTE family protein